MYLLSYYSFPFVANPDAGVRVSNAAVAADDSREHLPEISDMIICYPTMPGK